MPQLPTPFRAALGIVAIARDTIMHFPDKAIELPMLVVSTALQLSLRAQQRYAALAARGDELLAGQRTSDEPPPWARFDDPIPDLTIRKDAAVKHEAPSKQFATTDNHVVAGPDPSSEQDTATEHHVVAGPDPSSEQDAGTDGDLPARKPAKTTPARARKTVRRPRTGSPSAFDEVGEE